MTFARKRRGITILEVLTSILVAVIGVFGVVALIPFAVRQAETGLNQEDSINCARNVQQRFETMGLKASERWYHGPNSVGPVLPGQGISPTVRVYCLDPIGYEAMANAPIPMPFSRYGTFPNVDFTSLGGIPNFPAMIDDGAGGFTPGIRRTTFLTTNLIPYDKSLSRRVFGYENDLVFDNGNENAAPPAQQFFRSSTTGTNVKRQNSGNINCMTFIVGKGTTSNEYTMYTVVFRKRLPTNTDRIFRVTSPTMGTLYGGGDIQVTEVTTPPPDAAKIGRNDWIMMLNADPSDGPGTIRSLQYYRVIESYEADNRFTLQGGDFELSNAATPPRPLRTYLIYMPDVLAVYENTFRFESKSNWN